MKGDRARMEYIRTEAIRFDGEGWDDYLTRYFLDASALEESVKRSGVVEPVTVEEWRGGYRVVSGFKRAAAARVAEVESVPAVIDAEGALAPKDACLAALAANAPGTGLNDADRAVALAKARERLGFDEEACIL